MFFHEMRHFWQLFAAQFVKTPIHGRFVEKLQVSAKSTIFRVFSRSEALFGTFWNFLLKSSSKRRNTVLSSKSCKFWPNGRFFVFFHEMRHFFKNFPSNVRQNAETR